MLKLTGGVISAAVGLRLVVPLLWRVREHNSATVASRIVNRTAKARWLLCQHGYVTLLSDRGLLTISCWLGHTSV